MNLVVQHGVLRARVQKCNIHSANVDAVGERQSVSAFRESLQDRVHLDTRYSLHLLAPKGFIVF